MGFFPCNVIVLKRTGDNLIASWYNDVTAKWITKEFERGKVGDAVEWLQRAFLAIEM